MATATDTASDGPADVGPGDSAVDAPAGQLRTRSRATGREFVAMLATCMGMAALSIDVVLPAFPEMRESFGLPADSTRVSWVITAFFLGLAVGQLVYGPLSDRFGRKPMLYAGLAIYVASATAAALSTSLTGLIVCRVLWGIGAAAPRSLALAMARDTFEGERMARTMSHVMATFILVPVFAPGLGQGLMAFAPWRVVFWLPVAAAVSLAVWGFFRMPETLPPAKRRSVTPAALVEAARAVLASRATIAYGLAVTCLFGLMTSYIGSSEIIIDEVFGYGDAFPLIFGALALSLGVGSVLNASIVTRFGVHQLLRVGAVYTVSAALALAVVAVATGGHPPFWLFCALVALLLPGISMLIPNSNTAAMAPVAHVAGMAAALLGTVSTAGGALLGALVDSAFDGSVTPFAIGALAFAVLAATCILVVSRPAPS